MTCNKSMLSCLDSLKVAVSHSNQTLDNYALFDAYEFIIYQFYVYSPRRYTEYKYIFKEFFVFNKRHAYDISYNHSFYI